MGKRLEQLWSCMLAAVKKNPVEVLLIVFYCVLDCYLYESGNYQVWKPVLTYAPVQFLLVYLLNGLTQGSKGRWLYYLSGFLFLPVRLWVTEPISATWGVSVVVVQLLYLSSRWEKENGLFIQTSLRYVWTCLATGVLSVVAWLLSISVYQSIHYIFEIGEGWSERYFTYAAAFAFFGLMPLLFLMFNQGAKEEVRWNKALDVLVNFVLTPALLVYAVILYLYLIKIVVMWSLPKGGVALIVAAFTTMAFLLQGCQLFVSKRYYDWFFSRCCWVVLPALGMFWVGTFYRIAQYGFTELRVYLVLGGLVLTGMTFLFFSKRTGRYLYVALSAVVLLSVFTYIPGITAKDIERISQEKRGNDPESERRDDYREYIIISNDLPLDISEYETLQPVGRYDEPVNSTITPEGIFLLREKDMHVLFRADKDELLFRQMKKVGLSPADSIPEAFYPDILRLELDSALYVFGEIDVFRNSPDSAYTVSYAGGGYYLKKRVPLPTE